MDKAQFIAHFAATFMATYNAMRFGQMCMDGRAADLARPSAHPAEDALFIAEAAWAAFKEHSAEPRYKPECAVD